MRLRYLAWVVIAGLLVWGLRVQVAAGPAPSPSVQALPSPAAPGSGEPCLATSPSGSVFLSWFEKLDSTRHALKVSRLEKSRWSRPVTVAEGDSFFVNWADVPILLALDDQRLAIAWPWKHGGHEPYAYDVRMAFSTDGGRAWRGPTLPHRDDTPTEHGFVSLAPEGKGVRAVWLDGRKAYMKHDHGDPPAKEGDKGDGHGHAEMSLHTAWVGLDGSLAHEGQLDARVCDCCQTAATAVPGGVAVAYRDRGTDEVRDVSVLRIGGGSAWSEPVPAHRDNWKIEGCPVNGPSMDARGARVAVAWYTDASDTARVLLAFSQDGARSFGPPVRVDRGDPLGRTGVRLLADGSALVTWLENDPSKQALVLVRRVDPGGALGPTAVIARTGSSRASGFPRLVLQKDRVVFAWTETGERPQVKVAALPLPSGSQGDKAAREVSR